MDSSLIIALLLFLVISRLVFYFGQRYLEELQAGTRQLPDDRSLNRIFVVGVVLAVLLLTMAVSVTVTGGNAVQVYLVIGPLILVLGAIGTLWLARHSR